MFRTFLTATFAFMAMASAQAHFPFIIPEAEGTKANIVFSDNLSPDTRVDIEKISATKLKLRDAIGKESPLTMTKGENQYVVNLPGSGSRVIVGETDYGVLQQGESKPFRLLYHSKAIVGPATAQAGLGKDAPLEVVPVIAGGKTMFRVLSYGKPLANGTATILPEKGGKQTVKTDAEGLTPALEVPGRYGVSAKWFEAKPGEHAGLKYEEIRHYATLVVDTSAK